MSLKAGELKARVTKLTNEQSKITGYFNELIAWFGESKKDYKIDTFFAVLREFYEAFSAEMAVLEQKKKEAEETKKKLKAQEEMSRNIRAHAMDHFQQETEGLNSTLVIKKKIQQVRASKSRTSIIPTMNEPISSRRSMPMQRAGTGIQPQSSGMNLGVPDNRFNVDDLSSDSMSRISEVYSMSQEELSTSEDDLITESHMYKIRK